MIPPNRPCVREDEPDRLFATVAEKEKAIADQVVAAHATGRPVLIGTLDVAESERIARRLRRGRASSCVVLNAKNDAEEAAIVAEAGAPRRRSPSPPRWPGAAPTSGSAAREGDKARSPRSAGCT